MSFEEFRLFSEQNLTKDKAIVFITNYLREINNYSPANFIYFTDIMNLYDVFGRINLINEATYNNLHFLNNDDVIAPSMIKVTNIKPNVNYKLYIYTQYQYQYQYQYTIVHSMGVSNGYFSTSMDAKLNVMELGLSSYDKISSISITKSEDNSYIALVPEDAEFEAMSYNADGTLFCKFNQNGQLERYEYDAAGRVIKIYDNDNNLLKEFTYNVVLQ